MERLEELPPIPAVVETPERQEHRKMLQSLMEKGDLDGLEKYVNTREQELTARARLDVLTGLPNRRAFDDEAPLLFRQAEGRSALENDMRREVDFSLIFIDIDHFKRINDTYGHDAGDEALKAVVAALRTSTRPSDLVCRYGGEEFVVAFLGTGEAARLRVAERIRETVEQTEFTYNGERVPLTASLGAAKYQPGERMSDVVKRADQAMYLAKQTGRNRVVLAELPELAEKRRLEELEK